MQCIAGLCLRPCTTPDVQDLCSSTQRCTAVTQTLGDGGSADHNLCFTVSGRDESCNPWPCGTGLECEAVVMDPDTKLPMPESSTCHQPCAHGAVTTGCTAPERCLPSDPTLYERQVTADGGVPCTLGNPATCDGTSGWDCVDFAAPLGAQCGRPVSSCGTAVPIADLWEADGGNRLIPDPEVCNPGPALVDSNGNVVFPGSRFCDDYPALTNGPAITCEPFWDSQTSSYMTVGFCLGLCGTPDGQGGYSMTNCPSGYTCSTNPAYYFAVPSTPTTCTTTAGCSTKPGTVCAGPFGTSANKVCAYPYGTCQK